jgi:hypothetical protein
VKEVYDNATYLLRELDGTELKIPIAGKRVKIFRRRHEDHLFEDFDAEELDIEDQGNGQGHEQKGGHQGVEDEDCEDSQDFQNIED